MVEEELPMTMQVGMRAGDGILLASDTYWTVPPSLGRSQHWSAGRSGTNSTKFKIDHTKGIAIACAGDMDTAGMIADAIISGWQIGQSNPENVLEDFCDVVPDTDKKRAQCIVVLTRPNPQLFIVNTMPSDESVWEPWCRSSSTMMIAGDTVNSSIYWIEKYYRKWISRSLPMDRLIPLAAHMIGQAKTLNTAGIDGLEILLCNSVEIRRLSENSCTLLERQAEQWDEAIGDIFLGHQPQYVYGPNI
jgi:hypothetical protein